MVTIAVIDKYPLMLEALKNELGSYGQNQSVSVTLAKDVHSFKLANQGITPDLFILGFNEDLEKEGILAIGNIRSQFPSSMLIVLDDEIRPEIAIIALKAGAIGYLSKQDHLEEFTACVQKVLANKRYISSNLVKACTDFFEDHA